MRQAQTITSTLLLALLHKIGALPAIVALTLYALLPIVRNTLTSMEGVSPEVMEAARGIGMTRWQQLRIVRDRLAVKLDKETGKANIYPEKNFRLVTEVNYIAPIYWAMETIGRIVESRFSRGLGKWGPEEEMEGAIIFIGSAASLGNKGQISYSSAKAALEGAAATLMKEAIFHGVRCSIIHPGFTDTPILRSMGEEYLAKYVLPDTQLGRLIKPQEIADAICFMITNQAISGEIWADAGWHPAAA